MKPKKAILFMLAALLLSSLACSAIGDFVEKQVDEQLDQAQATLEAGMGDLSVEDIQATVEAELGEIDTESLQATTEALLEEGGAEELQATLEAELEEAGVNMGENVDTEFPLPDSVNNLTDAMGTIIFQTDMTLDETIAFYRNTFAEKGYTERDLLTSITDTTASLVFDGHESGQAIVLQLVVLGESNTNVTLRFEDV
jgi:hypothetical protein